VKYICIKIAACALLSVQNICAEELRISIGNYNTKMLDSGFDFISVGAGYSLNDTFDIEAQFDHGTDGEKFVPCTCPVGYYCAAVMRTLDYKNAAGLYFVGNVVKNDRVRLFLRAGFIKQSIKDSFNVFKTSQAGIGYGAGVEYRLDPFNGVQLDYTRYDQTQGFYSDALRVSYVRRLGK